MPTYKGKDGRWRYRFAFKGNRKGNSGTAPKGSNTQKTAAAMEKAHIERLLENRYTGVMPTVAKFVPQFIEYQKARVKPLTLENQEIHLRVHVVPILGKYKLDEIDVRELDLLVTEWTKKNAGIRTINTRLGTFARMLAVAAEWKMLTKVPVVTLLKVPHETVVFLSEEQATKLLAEAQKKPKRSDTTMFFSMILVGLRTGLRIGELRGLQWADIDFKRKVIHVVRSDPGRIHMESTSTKSNKGRLVPLTPDALATLADHLEAEKKLLGDKWRPDLWVWRSDGKQFGKRQWDSTRAERTCNEAIKKHAKAAGLKDIGFHTLRHTFASWLVMRGVPLIAVKELLGHADIKMTMKYAHLAPGFAHAQAVASLDFPLLAPTAPALPSGDEKMEDDTDEE